MYVNYMISMNIVSYCISLVSMIVYRSMQYVIMGNNYYYAIIGAVPRFPKA